MLHVSNEWTWFLLSVGMYLIIVLLLALVVVPYNNDCTWREYFANNHSLMNQLKTLDQQDVIDRVKYPVFYINLSRSPTRNVEFVDQMHELHLNHLITRVEGVDGKKLTNVRQGTLEDTNERFVNSYNLTPSELGCTLSHLRAIKRAYNLGHEIAVIVEDDACFRLMPYWRHSIPEMCKMLSQLTQDKKNWHVMTLYNRRHYIQPTLSKMISTNLKIEKEKENGDKRYFFPCPNDCGTVGYVINRLGMRKLLAETWQNDQWVLNSSKSSSGEADCFLYQVVEQAYMFSKSYLYTQSVMSTIHNKHIIGHLQASNRIIVDTMKHHSKKTI